MNDEFCFDKKENLTFECQIFLLITKQFTDEFFKDNAIGKKFSVMPCNIKLTIYVKAFFITVTNSKLLGFPER
jgi:hypothetical protein